MTAHPPPDAIDTRTRILEVAERLFRHYGYDKTTVADMARELGMSPANVYRFFGSKIEIVEAIAGLMFEERHRVNLAILNGEGTPSERLRRFFVENHRLSVETFTSERKVHDIVEVAMTQNWSSIEDHLAQFASVIEDLIRQGNACGEFDVAETRRAAICARQCFVSMIHPSLIVQCADDHERADAEELADFIIRSLRRR
ncbi:MAG: TetR family transcriptional regulator [Hyphomicrobiales bacterium]|nr:TetR family transcriptional regulator [Hyphomicrobiales bacterium]